MIWQEALPIVGSALGLGAVGVITYMPVATLQSRELLLPAELEANQVTALMRHIAAIREGPVCFTVRAARGRVRFFVSAREAALRSLATASGGLIPEAQLEEAVDDDLAVRDSAAVIGARVAWAGPWPLLRTTEPELTVAALLGVMAGIGVAERLELRLRLWPAGRVNRPATSSERQNMPSNPWVTRAFWPAQPPREDMRLLRVKYSGLLLSGEVLVASGAATMTASAANAQRVIAALRSTAGIRGVLRYRTVRGDDRVQRLLDRRRLPLPWEMKTLLSPEELTAIAGLPVGAPAVQGVSYGAAPRLMPPIDLPDRGRVFAVSNFPATSGRRLAQPVVGGLQHVAAVGPTGSGKSTLIASLLMQDLRAGRGAFVLDLKGDLVDDCLRLVPAGREHDVVVLEPARGGAQPGLKLFATGGDPELTSDLVLGTIQALFQDSWGIRSSQYLGLGLRTLAALPDATLVDLPALFTDPGFRTRAVARVRDPWLQAAWKRFLTLSAAERATHVSSPMTKLEELVGRGRLRLVLGQSDSKLDFRETLARGRLVLVSLPPGLLGMPATRLLAALTLWQFFQAVEARAAIPPERRFPFFAYVDEVAVLGDLPLPLESILERARGHGVGLTLSPQALSQLSTDLRQSLLANVGSLITFGHRSEKEAGLLAEALPGVNAEQIQHLGRHEIALRLGLGPGLTTGVMTGRTLPPEPPISDPAAIRKASAQRWGQTLEDIDAALARRHGLTDEQPSHEPLGKLGATRRRP